ncbi:MAG TPA: signal peptidase I [Candidatus Dormibacteraeota bacterium]|nr:signal peptidase I [Candidatus Dormibacteraeota bacterium]
MNGATGKPHRSTEDSAGSIGRPGLSKKSLTRRFLRWTEHILAGIGLCFIVYHFTFELVVMTSESMAPTLLGTAYENGDRILLEKVSGWLRSPQRWDIYHYYDDDGNPVTKRIVGLPGEKISIKDRTLLINGTALARPKATTAIRYYAYGNLANGQEVDCGRGYFMMGDASIDSLDSRYTGPVTSDRFRGRVWCILSPGGRRGFVR